MSDHNEIKHVYDGIEENDYPLPTWWLWTFFLTIIFSFIYYVHYEFGNGPTLTQELAVAMNEIEAKNPQTNGSGSLETDAELEKLLGSADLGFGATTYTQKCASCHGDKLQGLIGPNLVDNYWLNGKGAGKDVVKTIRVGVPEKGMPSWETLLKKDEVYALAAFIISKKGSNPEGAKPPQGDLVQ